MFRTIINRKVQIFLCLVLFTTSIAFAQKEYGAIEGTVRDTEGGLIPGATIVLTSPSLLGGTSNRTSDQNGRYRFPVLASGTYEVAAQIIGFEVVVRSSNRVFAGKTLIVDFTMKMPKLAQTVEIIEGPPLIDVTTTAVSFNIPPEIIQNLPKLQRIQDLIALTPGVSDGDALVDDRLVAYGADGEGASGFSIDGVNVGSQRSGTIFGEFNYNWIDEVHVTGIGAPAEYGGFTGVTANFVTRSGSNQYHGLFETFFQNEDLTDTNTPNPVLELPFTSYDLSAQIGGPILQDKFWFFAGTEYSQREAHPFGYQGVTREQIPKFIAKLNYKVNEDNSLNGYFHRNDPYSEGLDGSDLVLEEATRTVQGTQSSGNASWISILNSRTNFEVRAGGYYDRSSPVEENPDLPGHQDGRTGIFSVNSILGVVAKQSRFQMNATLSHYASDFIQGDHDFRFGVEFERSSESQDIYHNGGMFYFDLFGEPYQRGLISGQAFEGSTHRVSSFAQDEWSISDQFKLSLGLRWDHNRGITDRGTVLETDPVAPRIGFIWSPGKDNQTAIKAHYGDYYDALKGQHYFFLSDSASPTMITEEINEDGEWVEISRFRETFATGGGELKHPRVRQFSAGVDHVLPGQVPVGAHYIYRRFGNILEDVSVSGFEPVPFVNPLTGETITIYNRVDENITLYYVNPPDLYRHYHGFEIFAGKQISRAFSVSGSFVYSRANGNYVGGNTNTLWLNDPNSTNNFPGRLGESFSWKLVGTYAFPWGFNAGWYFRHESGDTWTARIFPIPVSQFIGIYAEPVGSRQLEAQNLLDLRVEKEFPIYGGQLRFTGDVFNLMNSSYVLGVNSRVGPSLGRPLAYNQPREIRLGVRYTF